MSLSCYCSSDPKAREDPQVYNGNQDSGELWQGPPSSCSSTFLPPPSQCVVCTVDQGVKTVCNILKEKVSVVMEAAGHQVDLTECACPDLQDDPVNSSWTLLQQLGVGFGVVAAVIVLVLLGFFLWKFISRRRGGGGLY